MVSYWDTPHQIPRYRGVSAPVSTWDAPAIELAKTHAVHAAYLEWAASADYQHWVPDNLVVEVADAVPEFFIRGKVAVVAQMTGRPVIPLPPEKGASD